MKDKFREFYPVDEDITTSYWETAIFSFDANVLLNLYRYTEDTRDEVLSVLEYLQQHHRIWLPYQVGLEYHSNRLTVIAAQKKAYEKLVKQLETKQREIEGALGEFQKHPQIDPQGIMNKLNPIFEELIEEAKELETVHPDYEENDSILDSITSIFEGVVGDAPSDESLRLIYKEGKDRYEKKIPPGYKDAIKKKDSGERSLFGDLIVWKELIGHFAGNETKLIFVTDDLKEDWWEVFDGKTQGPRPELLREFFRETGKEILIYKPQRFLELAAERFDLNVGTEAIGEVQEIRNLDERASTIYARSAFDSRIHTPSSTFTNYSSSLSNTLLKEIVRSNPELEERYNEVAKKLGLPKLNDPFYPFIDTYPVYYGNLTNFPSPALQDYIWSTIAAEKKAEGGESGQSDQGSKPNAPDHEDPASEG